MAVDYFLKIDQIDGESTDRKHKGSIEILSWSWGASQISGVTGTPRANADDLQFTHTVDKASPVLALSCASGKHIPKVELFVRKSGSTGGGEDYYVITLSDCLVSSFQQGGEGGDQPTEEISFNFGQVEFNYSYNGGTPISSGNILNSVD